MKCNLIQGIKVVIGVTYTDIDDSTDIAYFKDLEKLIPIYNENYNKRKTENFRTCDENEYSMGCMNGTGDFPPNDLASRVERSQSNREWMEREEAETLAEECKDVKINEMHAYDRNSTHTRALLQSIQLN